MPRTSAASKPTARSGLGGPQPARAALLAVARARSGDPRLLHAARPVLGIADIADELGMSRSTTHRYVITLVALGYLEQGASRKYRLGLRVTDLGMSALNSTGLRRARPPSTSRSCASVTSYTTELGVLDGDRDLLRRSVRSFRTAASARSTSTCTRLARARLLQLDGQAAAREPARGEQRELSPREARGRRTEQITSKACASELDQLRMRRICRRRAVSRRRAYSIAAPRRNEARDARTRRASMISLGSWSTLLAAPHGRPHLGAPRLPARRRCRANLPRRSRPSRGSDPPCRCPAPAATAAALILARARSRRLRYDRLDARPSTAPSTKPRRPSRTSRRRDRRRTREDLRGRPRGAVVARLGGTKGCEAAIKSQLAEVDNLEVHVESVTLAPGGKSATAGAKRPRRQDEDGHRHAGQGRDGTGRCPPPAAR